MSFWTKTAKAAWETTKFVGGVLYAGARYGWEGIKDTLEMYNKGALRDMGIAILDILKIPHSPGYSTTTPGQQAQGGGTVGGGGPGGPSGTGPRGGYPGPNGNGGAHSREFQAAQALIEGNPALDESPRIGGNDGGWLGARATTLNPTARREISDVVQRALTAGGDLPQPPSGAVIDQDGNTVIDRDGKVVSAYYRIEDVAAGTSVTPPTATAAPGPTGQDISRN